MVPYFLEILITSSRWNTIAVWYIGKEWERSFNILQKHLTLRNELFPGTSILTHFLLKEASSEEKLKKMTL